MCRYKVCASMSRRVADCEANSRCNAIANGNGSGLLDQASCMADRLCAPFNECFNQAYYNSIKYSGSGGDLASRGVQVRPAKTRIDWWSDGSIEQSGFEVCVVDTNCMDWEDPTSCAQRKQ